VLIKHLVVLKVQNNIFFHNAFIIILLFSLKVTDDLTGESGRVEMNLTRNHVPDGGSCTISPASGVAQETEFNIDCMDPPFQDEDGIQSYTVMCELFDSLVYFYYLFVYCIPVRIAKCQDNDKMILELLTQLQQNKCKHKKYCRSQKYNLGRLVHVLPNTESRKCSQVWQKVRCKHFWPNDTDIVSLNMSYIFR